MGEEDKDISEEIEVTSFEFSSRLFSISKSRYLSSLKLLASTEMTIHKDIERPKTIVWVTSFLLVTQFLLETLT